MSGWWRMTGMHIRITLKHQGLLYCAGNGAESLSFPSQRSAGGNQQVVSTIAACNLAYITSGLYSTGQQGDASQA